MQFTLDFYNYTYLNANGYLKKFRNYFNNPDLTLEGLNAILKTFFKMRGLRVYADDKGDKVVYAKNDLNFILDNPYFCMDTFKRIFKKWDDNKNKREWEKEEPSKADFRGDDDMDYQVKYLGVDESQKSKNIYITESQLKALETLLESEKKMTRKAIYITEAQYENLKKHLCENHYVDTDKVKIVKKYLDENFVKGGIAALGEDGYPTTTPIVALKGTDGKPMKNMSDKQLFALLLDKFGKIYADKEQVKKFLKQVIKDWYYDKISREGLLSVNEY